MHEADDVRAGAPNRSAVVKMPRVARPIFAMTKGEMNVASTMPIRASWFEDGYRRDAMSDTVTSPLPPPSAAACTGDDRNRQSLIALNMSERRSASLVLVLAEIEAARMQFDVRTAGERTGTFEHDNAKRVFRGQLGKGAGQFRDHVRERVALPGDS